MGDRVVLQCYGDGEVGPAVYGHWSGQDALAVIERLRERMRARPGDVAYWSARLVQELTRMDRGCLGFGIWNAPAKLTAKDSHGDAGVILIDVRNGSIKIIDSYLKEEKPRKPTVKP